MGYKVLEVEQYSFLVIAVFWKICLVKVVILHTFDAKALGLRSYISGNIQDFDPIPIT